jgi:hypothetical protein
MMLQKLRWLTAGLLAAAALLASPARSQAGIQILIQELDSGGNAVGASQYFTGVLVPSTGTTSFTNISITVTTTSGVSAAVNSLTTTVNMKPSATFDPTHSLRVWVTDDGFLNSNLGGTASVFNNASASSGIAGGQNALTNNSQLLSLPVGVPTTNPPSDTVLGPPTGDATDIRPSGLPSPQTVANVASLPGAFAIQQTITIRATPTGPGGIDPQSTLGGSASTVVLSGPPPGVPAPGGLVLALIGLPILGARRLRKKA